MCTTEYPDMNDFDENSWELLHAKLVVAAEIEDTSKFKKDAGVHVREQAGDRNGCREKSSRK